MPPEEATYPGAHPLVDMRSWRKDNPAKFEDYIRRMCEYLDAEYQDLCARAS